MMFLLWQIGLQDGSKEEAAAITQADITQLKEFMTEPCTYSQRSKQVF